MYKKFQLLSTLNLIVVSLVLSQDVSNELEVDYIECYWCNSRDMYCGKRVIDTMVTTVKCPKQSRCVVYTNPYDNYYLHRGCTYGMDLGELEVQNGCFVEEEGSTYCFCDFNRCNAAGILDLRNLIDEKNQTVEKIKFNTPEEFKGNFIDSGYLNDEEQMLPNKYIISDKNLDNSSKNTPIKLTKSSEIKTSSLPFKTSFEPFSTQFNRLLTDYLNYANMKNVNSDKSEILKNKILKNLNENENLLKKFQEFSNKLKSTIEKSNLTILNSSNQTETTSNYFNSTNTNKPNPKETQPTSTKTYSPLDLFKQYNKLSTKVMTKVPLNKQNSTIKNLPQLYKFKINDTLSKSILENPEVRSNLGMKPNDKLSILIKRPLDLNEQKNKINQAINSLKNNNGLSQNFIKLPDENDEGFNFFETLPVDPVVSSTSSWLSKLKAKLSQALSSTQAVKLNQNINNLQFTTTVSKSPNSREQDWTKVLSDGYRKAITKLNFKCPRDGLFSHPTNCSQFIQCVDYGTYHERFYIQNCPYGLYFNQKLALCDYVYNVLCLS